MTGTELSEYRRLEESVDLSHQAHPIIAGSGDQELLTLNMGPHHPATHGVLRLLVTLDGEVVQDLKPIIGFMSRTTSPSSVHSSRSTPCVAGWCGPMLSVSSSSSPSWVMWESSTESSSSR